MSLIIKDVDMPKSGESITYSSKEIIEIPTPHGRLIDADFLLDTIRYGAEGRAICDKCISRDCQNCAIKSVYRIIREAPTIIEAEVNE